MSLESKLAEIKERLERGYYAMKDRSAAEIDTEFLLKVAEIQQDKLNKIKSFELTSQDRIQILGQWGAMIMIARDAEIEIEKLAGKE